MEVVSLFSYLSDLMDTMYEKKEALFAKKEKLDKNLKAIVDDEGVIKKQYLKAYDKADKEYKKEEKAYQTAYGNYVTVLNLFTTVYGMGLLYFNKTDEAYGQFFQALKDAFSKGREPFWPSFVRAQANFNIVDLKRTTEKFKEVFIKKVSTEYSAYMREKAPLQIVEKVVPVVIKNKNAFFSLDDAEELLKIEPDLSKAKMIKDEYIEIPESLLGKVKQISLEDISRVKKAAQEKGIVLFTTNIQSLRGYNT